MGIFGPIDDSKVLEIIKENIEEITNETWQAMVTVNASRTSVNGTAGDQLMWNMISKAEVEIPAYILKEELNISPDYPYGDPSIYVACAIYNRYINAAKEDKKFLSNGITRLKKDGLQGLVNDLVKVYCDNIEKSLIKPRPYDKQKESAIRVLAESLQHYNLIFSRDINDSKNSNGNQRKR